jgi:HEAT repeat protein
MPSAGPYLEADAELTRGAAARALRLAPQPEAAEKLADLALQDPDAFVRVSAVRSLGSRGVSDFTVGVLERVVLEDAAPSVRGEALSILSRFASEQPQLASRVERLAQQSSGS